MYKYNEIVDPNKVKVCEEYINILNKPDGSIFYEVETIVIHFLMNSFVCEFKTNKENEIKLIKWTEVYNGFESFCDGNAERTSIQEELQNLAKKGLCTLSTFDGKETYTVGIELIQNLSEKSDRFKDMIIKKIQQRITNMDYDILMKCQYITRNNNMNGRLCVVFMLMKHENCSYICTVDEVLKACGKKAKGPLTKKDIEAHLYELQEQGLIYIKNLNEIKINKQLVAKLSEYVMKLDLFLNYLHSNIYPKNDMHEIIKNFKDNYSQTQCMILCFLTAEFLNKTLFFTQEENGFGAVQIEMNKQDIKSYLLENIKDIEDEEIEYGIDKLVKDGLIELSTYKDCTTFIIDSCVLSYIIKHNKKMQLFLKSKILDYDVTADPHLNIYLSNLMTTSTDVGIVFRYIMKYYKSHNEFFILKNVIKKDLDKQDLEDVFDKLNKCEIFVINEIDDAYHFNFNEKAKQLYIKFKEYHKNTLKKYAEVEVKLCV